MGTTTPICVGFDGAALAGTYSPPVLDLEDDVSVMVNTAPWMAAVFGGATYAKVDRVAFSGWTGNALSLSNVYLAFDFRGTLEHLTFRFHNNASRHYIEINRDPREFREFSEVNGKTIGGVGVTVSPSPMEPREGTVEIVGLINTLVIGSGEMLWIDDLCYERKPE